MNPNDESAYYEDWKRMASRDWFRISILLRENDPEGASFFLQQSLEKYLKAFLLKNGWSLRKLHELDTLLDIAVQYNDDLEKFRELCECVSGYYLTERYPMIIASELTVEDILGNVVDAQALIQVLFPDDSVN